MNFKTKAIRTFLGAENFNYSRSFYQSIGFEEKVIDAKMSYFKVAEDVGFYLQDYYVKAWVENSMVFLEVEDVDHCFEEMKAKDLQSKFPEVRMSQIKDEDWGREFHLIDPAGVLWHFAKFKTQPAI